MLHSNDAPLQPEQGRIVRDTIQEGTTGWGTHEAVHHGEFSVAKKAEKKRVISARAAPARAAPARTAPRKAGRSAPVVTTQAPQEDVASMIESVVGCKWSIRVLSLIRNGVRRPGAMTRAVEGLSTKVLGERLDKFLRFGVLERVQYPEIPPRVEYRFTAFGERFVSLIDAVRILQDEVDTLAKAAPARSQD